LGQIQTLGFYWAGFLSMILAVLKLTIEGHWSWWRVLLPVWVVLGHNALYVTVGFDWRTSSPPARPLVRRPDSAEKTRVPPAKFSRGAGQIRDRARLWVWASWNTSDTHL
jgi:hypothetical protein